MKYALIKLTVMLTLVLTLWACDDPLTTGSAGRTTVLMTVEMPELPEGAEIVDQLYTFKNVTSGKSYEFSKNAEIELIPGLYDVAYTARVLMSGGSARTNLRANQAGVNIIGSTVSVNLTAYNSVDNNDLIIAEVFFAGTLRKSGNQYVGDDYIKLYNNTDKVIYADGLTLFETKFLTTRKYDFTPDIMNEAVTVQALYTIPGNGTDVPVPFFASYRL